MNWRFWRSTAPTPPRRGRVQCIDCRTWWADTLKTFPEFDHQPVCFGCVLKRREAGRRWKFVGRTDLGGVPHYVWVQQTPIAGAPGCYAAKIHTARIDRFWPKPQIVPVEPIYLGSQVIVERHPGVYTIDHYDAADELTHTEPIGDVIDLNFRLLGIERPRR